MESDENYIHLKAEAGGYYYVCYWEIRIVFHKTGVLLIVDLQYHS
jgi:hypothetical protein